MRLWTYVCLALCRFRQGSALRAGAAAAVAGFVVALAAVRLDLIDRLFRLAHRYLRSRRRVVRATRPIAAISVKVAVSTAIARPKEGVRF